MPADVSRVAAEARRQWVRAALRTARRWSPFRTARTGRCAACDQRLGPYAPRWEVQVAGLLNDRRVVHVCGACASTAPFEGYGAAA